MGHIEGLCNPNNSARFICAGAKVIYNASIIWGTIGPQRMFQHGQVYSAIMYFFLIGVSFLVVSSKRVLTITPQPVFTVVVYLIYRRYPNSWVKYVNPPIL